MSDIIPRLSGETFFTLILEARKPKSGSQEQCFKELLSIYDETVKAWTGSGLKSTVSQYKNGILKSNSSYINLGNEQMNLLFEDRIRNDYPGVLSGMIDFSKNYLEPSGKKKWLIAALLELIEEDTSIDKNELFYVNPGHTPLHKHELAKIHDVYYYNFLFGVWHYICTTKNKMGAGRETILEWTTDRGKRSERKFNSQIGHDKYQNINIIYDAKQTSTDFENCHKDSIYPVKSRGEIAPNLGNRNFNSSDFLIIESRNTKIYDNPFGKYLESAENKHSKKTTFLYETERKFESFYVCNDIRPKIISPIHFTNLTPEEKLGAPIKNVTILSFPQPQRNILLFGTGGLGKTMMMTHLMLNTIRMYNKYLRIPIFITLRDYDSSKNDLLDFIFTEFNRHDRNLTLDDLTKLLSEGLAVLLMDGYDEIKSAQLDTFNKQLDLLLDQFPNNFVIISSRRNRREDMLSRFAQYLLQPFSLEQATAMISKLDASIVSNEVKNDFIKDLKKDSFNFSRDEKTKFLGNPLFISIMLLTYENYHDIPTQRYLFYENAYEAMAQKHDATKSLRREFATGLNSREFKQHFGEFCAITYYAEKYSFTEKELKAYFQEVIDANHLMVDSDTFIVDITEKICLLYLDGKQYYFIHRSFQEYFTAYFFSLQLEQSYDAIYNMFKSRDMVSTEDETLSMLYGIDKKKTEKHIFIPFLESIFTDDSDDKNYKNFLLLIYQSIRYTVGNINYFPINKPCSNIYTLISNEYILARDPFEMEEQQFKPTSEHIISDLPLYKSFVLDECYSYNKNWTNPNAPQDLEETMLSELPDEYIQSNLFRESRPIGYVCEIKFEEIYSDPKKYQAMINEIENEHFVLKAEYLRTKQLLLTLKGKYEKREPSASFISQFH
ncbi:MAG: NACHT domain-containing protein [Acetatifactor sp.]|nr:NACHT domain-containing protein [Acetatifactor sp.]